MDFTSVPAVAVATLIASVVAALAALGVAAINVRSNRRQALQVSETARQVATINVAGSRRLALDAAQREYRQALTTISTEAHLAFTESWRRCLKAVVYEDGGKPALDDFLKDVFEVGGTPAFHSGNDVLDAATSLAAQTRTKITRALAISAMQEPLDAGTLLFQWAKRLDEITVVLRKAAEIYIFESADVEPVVRLITELQADLARYDSNGILIASDAASNNPSPPST